MNCYLEENDEAPPETPATTTTTAEPHDHNEECRVKTGDRSYRNKTKNNKK
jgi:hypothetical protein